MEQERQAAGARPNIRVGRIVNCHGIRGELVVLPLTDDVRRFRKLKEALLELPDGRFQPVTVEGARLHKGNVLLTLKDLRDRTAAERLKNLYLCVRPEDAVKPEGSYFLYEIVGLAVYEGDACYGRVTAVLQNGSADLYEVQDGRRTFYLPALKSVVKRIDLERGRMEVELPAGLLD